MKYTTNRYRFKEFGKKFLITTDLGSWCFLDKRDFELLSKEKIKEKTGLFNLLEEKGVILTEKNKGKIVEKIRKKYSFLGQGTSLHIIIPTLRCNMKCVYCHASSKSLNAKGCDMNKKTAKKVVDFIFQSPSFCITIEFQGGEPLLRFDIIKYIIEYSKQLNQIYKKNLLFAVVSNFTLMDEEKLDYLIKNKVGICTSLDGPSRLHNINRGFSKNKSYFYVDKWLNRLHEEYKKRNIDYPRPAALITITKQSLPYWKEIVDNYVKLNLKDINLRFLNNLGDARPVWNTISYSTEEFINFWKKAMEYILKLNKKGIYIREWLAWIILRKLVNEEEPGYLEQRSPCGAVIGQLAYDYNGDIYSCDEARMIGEDLFKLGNVKKDNYNKILTSNQTCSIVAASINDTQICDGCVYKPYCGICPVCNYAEQGSVIANIPKTARCKIYNAQFDYIFKKLQNPADKRVFMEWLKRA